MHTVAAGSAALHANIPSLLSLQRPGGWQQVGADQQQPPRIIVAQTGLATAALMCRRGVGRQLHCVLVSTVWYMTCVVLPQHSVLRVRKCDVSQGVVQLKNRSALHPQTSSSSSNRGACLSPLCCSGPAWVVRPCMQPATWGCAPSCMTSSNTATPSRWGQGTAQPAGKRHPGCSSCSCLESALEHTTPFRGMRQGLREE